MKLLISRIKNLEKVKSKSNFYSPIPVTIMPKEQHLSRHVWTCLQQAYSILVSAPVPFGFRSYWDLVGVGPRGCWELGQRVWGQGLTKSSFVL